ncbi:MAG: cyclodeaminase/cyclohydrolase family protein [Lachnospiraceae bacterium]
MSFCDKTCNEFIEVLASKEPVPGGGGASALIGAIGMALGNMVGSLTVGKKKYADVEENIKGLMDKSAVIIHKLTALVDKDAEAFSPLAAAYSLPKETEEEKEYKARVMAEALLTASAVPLEIMEVCCEAIDLVEEYAAKGSRLAVSDAGVAAIALRSALMGASLNVFINTGSMADREKANELNAKAENMISVYGEKAEKIFYSVKATVERNI